MQATATTATLPDSPAEVLTALRSEQDLRRASDVRSMQLAAHWVALHPAANSEDPAGCFQSPKTLAGEGSPAIDEFCVPEVATKLGTTCDSVGSYLTDVIELRYRLPRLWAAVLMGDVTPWRARVIAQTTVDLTPEAAAFVDQQTAWCANRVTPSQLMRLVAHARARFMPDQLAAEIEAAADKRHVTFVCDQVSFDGTMHLEADLEVPDALGLAQAVADGAARLADLGSTDTLDGRRATALGDLARHQLAFGFDDVSSDERTATSAKPATTQIVLHAHLSADAILRINPDGDKCLSGYVEQAGHRGLTADQIRDWCGRPGVQITVKPVIDLHERLETAGYTPTDRIRDHVITRDRTCVFPWCGRNARRCDLDHVVPFDHTDPTRGGPTSTDNLAPLCRRHHRLKTKGRWRYRMTDPGVFIWTSPLGDQFLRDHTGSRPLEPEPRPEPRPERPTERPTQSPTERPTHGPAERPTGHPPDQ
ncbi:HNH endonuclease signature motif containing protein [Nocardioides sp.]|uniref:HNH endonuclease signature motif containing protein n=1 Tax=Nocardioides sp. TaxID=35761 RepID=UPI002CCDC816|nr:DUF222 domain-containing protein [Nocardioides sp.]HXH80792.1 DUF222 domain-containing protein [Nocardioides sp.]